MRFSFIRAIMFCGLVALASPAFSVGTPPPSAEVKDVEALVKSAAAEIEKKGSAAFAEFRKKGGAWFHGDTYVFAYNQDGVVLLNAAFPEAERTNALTGNTARGVINPQVYSKEFFETVKAKGEGWVGYMYTRPGQTEPTQKWSFVKGVRIDGKPGLVGAGFYPK